MLGKRLDAAGWQHRVLSGAVPADELVAMKINALLVDLTVLDSDDVVDVPRAGRGADARARRDRLHATTRPSPSASAACGSAPTTGSPSPVIPRRSWPGSRRSSAAAAAPAASSSRGPLVIGELEIRPDQFQAFVAGRSLDLTRREFELLKILSESAGTVLERGEIYRRVWGYEMAHGDRSVDVFVRKLRSKIQRRSPGLELHPHALRDRLPLRGGARRRRGRLWLAAEATAARRPRSRKPRPSPRRRHRRG